MPPTAVKKKQERRPLLIAVPDLHLSDLMPRGRNEENWLTYQISVMGKIAHLAESLLGENIDQPTVPVAYVGDVFHRFNPSPSLVNAALRYLPEGYAIAGQHDMRSHNLTELSATGFHTLELAGRFQNLNLQTTIIDNRTTITGFPFGTNWQSVEPLEQALMEEFPIRIAISHEFVWSKTSNAELPLCKGVSPYSILELKYPDGESRHVRERFHRLGYTHVFTGDNHIPFFEPATDKLPLLANGGSVMARSYPERGRKSFASILYTDGSCEQHEWNLPEEWKDQADAVVEMFRAYQVPSEHLRNLLDRLNRPLDESASFVDKVKRQLGNSAALSALFQSILEQLDNHD